MTTPPSLTDFLRTARRGFSLLVSEFGLVKQPDNRPYPNAYSVHYASSSTAVDVDGINWGVGVQVMLRSVSALPGTPPYVPLWALVEHRTPDESQSRPGQLAQLAYYASQLRRHADATSIINPLFEEFLWLAYAVPAVASPLGIRAACVISLA